MKNYKEILVEAMKTAIASGISAAEISRQTGVSGSIISRIIGGKQDDIRAGDYFKIIECMPQQVQDSVLLQLGIKRAESAEVIKQMSEDELAELVLQLSGNQKAKILEAIAQSMLSPKPTTKQKVPA